MRARRPNTAASTGVEVSASTEADTSGVQFPRRRHAAVLPTRFLLPTGFLQRHQNNTYERDQVRQQAVTYSGLLNKSVDAVTNEKALTETQTLRAGCSKAEPNIFAPPQTPFPGAQDGQNLIS